jgi:HlyD family secretion protein
MQWLGWRGLLLFLGFVLAVVGGAAGGLLLSRYWSPWPPHEVAGSQGERLGALKSFGKLRSEAPQNRVAALGRLQPRGEVIDVGGAMGEKLGKLLVKEGDLVKEDQELGRLDSYNVRKAQRDAAVAQLADARARLKAETAYADALVAEAQVGLRQADKLAPLDVQAQEAKVRALESELTTAQADLQRLQNISIPGAVSAQKMDQQAQGVRRVTEELAAARVTLTKAREGQGLQRDQAQAKVAAAEAGRRRVEASAQIASLEKNVEMAEAQLQLPVLRAPRDGTILQIVARPGERVDQRPVLKMGDLSVMYAVAEVYETDLPLVRPGQPAVLTSQALSSPLNGTVERVSRLIRRNEMMHIDPRADTDARVAQAWVRLAAPEVASKLVNLQVDVEIDVSGLGIRH